MKSRLIIIFVLVCSAWTILVVRALDLQILPNQKLKRLQARQFNTVVELSPRRGAILDRNGAELASSIPAYSLFADPLVLQNPKDAARRLSKKLNLNFQHLYAKLRDKKKRFVWIERRLDEPTRDSVQRMKIAGLDFVEESRRIFLNEGVLSQVLGFIGTEGKGLEGLEARYEPQLHGERKKIFVRRDALGRPLIVNGQILSDAIDGSDLLLTIDSELQYALEKELLTTLKKQRAQSVLGIVMDPRSSEILAMASLPGFNPNHPMNSDSKERRNRAVTDPIEPGSTMKTFTIATALKENVAAPNSKFYCEKGHFKIGDRVINEAEKNHEFEWLTLSEILAYSSNIGSSKVALQIGDERLEKSFREFGFGEKTGVDMFGESRGIFPTLPWRDHLIANISFGHGIAATPLQVANAYAAIANGGELYRPYIVKSVRNKETAEFNSFDPVMVRRVMTKKQAATLNLMLMGVTGPGGTGVKARVNGYPVAGKTGTAQKIKDDGTYSKSSYVSSFAGYIPANDPRFVIYIVVDDPKEDKYGADVAAPVFAKIASMAVRRSGLSPILITEKNVMKQSEEKTAEASVRLPAKHVPATEGIVEEITVPPLIGLSLREAVLLLRDQGLNFEVSGRGRVAGIEPAVGSVLTHSQKIKLHMRE